jgi:EmrB/QacA subfamily drug resistance transporter
LKSIIKKQDKLPIEGEALTPSIRWALAGLSLCILLSTLSTSIANVALPTLAQAFSASFQQVQWIILAYLLSITSLVVSAGRLGDLMGRRRLLLAGIFLFTVSSVLCSMAPTLWLLIAARAVQGLGAAIMMALTLAFVSETVPRAKTGSAMGLLGSMSAIGIALGPAFGGLLIANFGWPSIFFINVPLGILALFLSYCFLPLDKHLETADRSTFDYLGTLLLALTLGAYALAVTIEEQGNFGWPSMTLLLVAIFGLGIFIFAESKITSPLIRLAVFKNPVLSAGFAMNILVMTLMMATLVVGPFYLSGALAFDAAHIGLIMSCGPIVAALGGIPSGRIVDRFGASYMTIAGLIVMSVGSSALPLVPASFGALGYITPLVFITAGYALFQAANNTAVMTHVTPNERGVISGILNLSRNLGLITGAAVMGSVFALGSETTNIMTANPAAIANGMQITFAVAAILIVIALGIASVSHVLSRHISATYPCKGD